MHLSDWKTTYTWRDASIENHIFIQLFIRYSLPRVLRRKLQAILMHYGSEIANLNPNDVLNFINLKIFYTRTTYVYIVNCISYDIREQKKHAIYLIYNFYSQ